MTNRQLFLTHLAQTSLSPLALEIVRAEGTCLWGADGKQYLDLIAGIGVCALGHCHPAVVEAVRQQSGQYMHLMVYGELIQSPQVLYAQLLANHLPPGLQTVYFTNSGTEATEGAMKLAKRYTGRTEILAFRNGYHGSTQGALSVMGSEYWRKSFEPLLPGIGHLEFNAMESLEAITNRTAAVIAETVQGEAGVIIPDRQWMGALRRRCEEAGALLILDEVQCGFGRNGTLWAFEQFGCLPDILLLGKALGGGMPLGAFISDHKIMESLSHHPELGHITTFGGHPVCCAAGMAAMEALLAGNYMEEVEAKGELFRRLLQHPRIRAVRNLGLMLALDFDSPELCRKAVDYALRHGVLTDWFLFSPRSMRIAPPLVISMEEIHAACQVILEAADFLGKD